MHGGSIDQFLLAVVFRDEKVKDYKDYIDESRKTAICASIGKRIQKLKEIARVHPQSFSRISTEDDVEADIAEDYT